MVLNYRVFYADHFGISISSKFALGAQQKICSVKPDFRKKHIFVFLCVFIFKTTILVYNDAYIIISSRQNQIFKK